MPRYRKSKKNIKSRLKRKSRKRGGGVEEKRVFGYWRMRHEYISKIGQHKPVATPNSGSEFPKAIGLWNALDDDEKKLILEKLGITAYITPNNVEWNATKPNIQTAAPILFYSPKYLSKLAEAADMPIEELLELLSQVQKDSLKMDIIKIAFGDVYGLGSDPRPLETEEGQLIQAKYESLLQKH